MRLLYLYVDDKGYFSPLEISFNGEFVFSFDKDSCALSLTRNESALVGEDFFVCTDHQRSSVDDISVIVGKNGAGKTSVARFLKRIRECKPNEKLEFDYILVYETLENSGKVWHFQSFIEIEEYEHFRTKEVRLPLNSIPDGVSVENHNETRSTVVQDFEFIYYTPHLTVENPFGDRSDALMNLSPNFYLSGQHDNENTLAKFSSAERRRALDFIRYMRQNSDSGENGFPLPQKVRIELNRIFYSEHAQWLNGEIRRLREEIKVISVDDSSVDRGEEKTPDREFTENRLRSFLQIARQVKVDYRKLDHRYSRRYRDFMISAFGIYVLSVLRQVKYFTLNNVDPEAKYGARLIDILRKAVMRLGDNGISNNELRGFVLSELAIAVRDEMRPGTILSSKMQLQSRTRAVEAFKRLNEWCGSVEVIDRSLDCILLPSSDAGLYEFIDDYGWSIHAYDYLYISFAPTMSAGDMSYLTMHARITGCIEAMGYARAHRNEYHNQETLAEIDRQNPLTSTLSKEVLLFLDEAETTLHSTRQLELLTNILRFCQTIYDGYRFHVVFATHSPILLSDVPMSHAIVLSSDDGKRVQVVKDCLGNTFGANIFDLYRVPFFMTNGTTGSFAQGKIDGLSKKLTKTFDSYGRLKGEFHFTEDDKKLIALIGEDRIRRYFEYWADELEQMRK